YVWGILAGSAVGLLASTQGRLYASVWYALRDTRQPLRFALVRLFVTTALGIVLAFFAPGWLGLEARWGAAGLTLAAGVAGWVEFALLRRSLVPRIGRVALAPRFLAALWGSAAASAASAFALEHALPPLAPVVGAALVLGVYGGLYFGIAALLGVDESRSLLKRLRAFA
ncbi:MAG TPA: lipid II flippase MurJ, partial [Myxococcota bacterium]|nr:lipid II flippase MurJ [Myxococcota bacterium]